MPRHRYISLPALPGDDPRDPHGVGNEKGYTFLRTREHRQGHHKKDAAAQARALKLLLQQRKSQLTVFIDSDDLKELDDLFDLVN